MIETRRYHADVAFRLRAADANAAAGDQFTSATVSQREQDDVLAMTMARQLTGTKLAVFELDAIPRSFPLAHYSQGLIGVIHKSESNGTPVAVAYLLSRSRIASRARLKARMSP